MQAKPILKSNLAISRERDREAVVQQSRNTGERHKSSVREHPVSRGGVSNSAMRRMIPFVFHREGEGSGGGAILTMRRVCP